MPNRMPARLNVNQLMQQVQTLRQDPVFFLRSIGLNLPSNPGDPNSIIQYLMNSGQVSQQQYDRARQIAANLKR